MSSTQNTNATNTTNSRTGASKNETANTNTNSVLKSVNTLLNKLETYKRQYLGVSTPIPLPESGNAKTAMSSLLQESDELYQNTFNPNISIAYDTSRNMNDRFNAMVKALLAVAINDIVSKEMTKVAFGHDLRKEASLQKSIDAMHQSITTIQGIVSSFRNKSDQVTQLETQVATLQKLISQVATGRTPTLGLASVPVQSATQNNMSGGKGKGKSKGKKKITSKKKRSSKK